MSTSEIQGDGSDATAGLWPGAHSAAPPDGVPATISIATATDIWFPHNRPAHRVHDGPIDNRAVSARNAPRLNAFLTEVRTACQTLDGSWKWTRTPPGIWEVDDEGLVRAG